MADLYKSSAGAIVKSTVGSPSFISVDGFDGLLRGGKMLVTSIKIDRAQEVQIIKTLSNLYYIYAFGESPGRVMIGGMIFFANCGSRSVTGDIVGQLNSTYESKCAYNNSSPVRISGGGATFRTILTGFSISGDMNPHNQAAFSLSFTTIPPP